MRRSSSARARKKALYARVLSQFVVTVASHADGVDVYLQGPSRVVRLRRGQVAMLRAALDRLDCQTTPSEPVGQLIAEPLRWRRR